MTNYLITGANRGIGLELCRQLSSKDNIIFATCRKVSKELKSLKVNIISNVDISNGNSVVEISNSLGNSKINVLINNAGIYENNQLINLDPESILRQFQVNALSPLCLTTALIPKIESSGKIIFITSRMASIEDNTSGGSYGYRMSKIALSMAAKSLAIDLYPRNIAIGILHPGLVSTQMTGYNGISTYDSAKGLIERINDLCLENSGQFLHQDGTNLPW